MIPAPEIHLSVLAPIGFVAIGSMLVLMGEVFLTRTNAILGRKVTEEWIGSVLAGTSMLSLGLALYVAVVAFTSGTAEVFNPGHAMIQLDRFSALAICVVTLGALLSCGLAISYISSGCHLIM